MFTKLMEMYRKYKEIILYVFFGGLATVVSIGSFAWCDVVMHMDPLVANLISWILAVTFAYITNSLWVFDARPHGIKELLCQAAGFFGGRVLTLVIEEAILLIFIKRPWPAERRRKGRRTGGSPGQQLYHQQMDRV